MSIFQSFELNLYGIEIAKALTILWLERKFELNLYGIEIHSVYDIRDQKAGFELNLYGIEIGDTNGIEDGQSVWIEPLWNWNVTSGYAVAIADTFELNLYGIEIKLCRVVLYMIFGFELNLYGIEIWSIRVSLWILYCLNWTFMELKSRNGIAAEQRGLVWIEPLWNWNTNWSVWSMLLWNVWIEPLWNWNCSRRTACRWARMVWIEPLWNWNHYHLLMFFNVKMFELNLYGIEIRF